jgi:hypothetical protein
MRFLPTLQRQQAWCPQVYNSALLVRCAKYGHTPETPEHILECADRAEVEAHFRTTVDAIQPRDTPPTDVRLRCCGRIHAVSALRPGGWMSHAAFLSESTSRCCSQLRFVDDAGRPVSTQPCSRSSAEAGGTGKPRLVRSFRVPGLPPSAAVRQQR